MDPLLYLRALRRRWWLIVAVTVLALGAAVATLPEQSDVAVPAASSYTATHVLLQSPDATTEVNLSLTSLYATTGQVPRLAAETLGRPPEEGAILAAQKIQITVDADIGAMRFTATDADPDEAVAIADAFAKGVQDYLVFSATNARNAESQALQETLDRLSAQVQQLGQQIATAGTRAPLLEAEREALTSRYQAAFERQQSLLEAAAVRSPLDTLQAAVPIPVLAVGNPVPTSPTARLGLSVLLGLLLGAALVLVVDRLDTRVRTRVDAEETSGLPVVAEVPRLERAARGVQEIVSLTQPEGAVAEAYRALRSTLLLVPARPLVAADATVPPLDLSTWRPPQVVLVTSAAPSDGKTSTAVNLASTLAESGRSVIVLDADFRKPAANAFLGVPHSVGLSDLLAGGVPGGLRATLRDTVAPGVRMVTAGSSRRHPATLLARLGALIEEARTLADCVVVDSAPLLLANDATDIVPHVDAVLFVAHAGKTTRPQTERSMELLARLAVPVLGVVLQASREVRASGDVGYYAVRDEGDPSDPIDHEPVQAPEVRGVLPVRRAPAEAPEPEGGRYPAGDGREAVTAGSGPGRVYSGPSRRPSEEWRTATSTAPGQPGASPTAPAPSAVSPPHAPPPAPEPQSSPHVPAAPAAPTTPTTLEHS